MKSHLRRFVFVLACAFSVFVAHASLAKTVNVTVSGMGIYGELLIFSPAGVTIAPGDIVEWDWAAGGHSTTSGPPGTSSGLWDSGVLPNGATFSHTFPNVGSFPYHCSVHGLCCNMTGAVNVVAPSPTPTPSPTPLLPLIGSGPVKVELQTVASGLTAPNDIVPSGDGRLFIVEQTGQIRLVKKGALVTTPFLDVSTRLVTLMPSYDERGLLGVAFHPGFNDAASPGFGKFYTYTSEPVAGSADFTVPDPSPFDHQSVVAEWKVSTSNPDVADPATRREILRVDEPEFNHNGGKLAFRPGEPYLYISLGDGGNANDVGDGHNAVIGNGQDLTRVLGKILRIDPLDPALTASSKDPVSVNGNYRVPASNPFIGSTTDVHEIYAYGLRNPFRFSFDEPTNRLIVGDVGQNTVEEVDFVESGKNYGWNRKEGSFLFDPNDGSIMPDTSPDPTLVEPVLEYSH